MKDQGSFRGFCSLDEQMSSQLYSRKLVLEKGVLGGKMLVVCDKPRVESD